MDFDNDTKPPPDPRWRVPLFWKLYLLIGVFMLVAGLANGLYFRWFDSLRSRDSAYASFLQSYSVGRSRQIFPYQGFGNEGEQLKIYNTCYSDFTFFRTAPGKKFRDRYNVHIFRNGKKVKDIELVDGSNRSCSIFTRYDDDILIKVYKNGEPSGTVCMSWQYNLDLPWSLAILKITSFVFTVLGLLSVGPLLLYFFFRDVKYTLEKLGKKREKNKDGISSR
ncbi:MAG: hypothetical protein E3J72_18155 [Planctomycetota bacterium]|nr:MAG: hypothetical protein E3J72_18155 [Planctomycetota bacterium]